MSVLNYKYNLHTEKYIVFKAKFLKGVSMGRSTLGIRTEMF